jgi:ATP-dependent DNA ligase
MSLPIPTTYPVMEALLVDEIPTGPDWQYEPKWDGFRCLAFKDGSSIHLQSKSGQPLARYFPEIVETLRELAPERLVLDGEIVIPVGRSISFDHLLQRIHPAESRIKKLAEETPSIFIVFDLLVDEKGRSLVGEPLAKRRPLLEAFAHRFFPKAEKIRLSPATSDVAAAKKWLSGGGKAVDGIIAKRLDLDYDSGSGERTGMQKVKLKSTADCVVGGFRYGTNSKVIGSLLLGLYDAKGLLHHVGFSSSIKAKDKEKLTRELLAIRKPPGFTGRAPGGPSRWSTERTGEWEPLAPTLVVEIEYDHFTGGRFRHGTKLLRFRPDKSPKQCTMDQIAKKGRASPLKLLEG